MATGRNHGHLREQDGPRTRRVEDQPHGPEYTWNASYSPAGRALPNAVPAAQRLSCSTRTSSHPALVPDAPLLARGGSVSGFATMAFHYRNPVSGREPPDCCPVRTCHARHHYCAITGSIHTPSLHPICRGPRRRSSRNRLPPRMRAAVCTCTRAIPPMAVRLRTPKYSCSSCRRSARACNAILKHHHRGGPGMSLEERLAAPEQVIEMTSLNLAR